MIIELIKALFLLAACLLAGTGVMSFFSGKKRLHQPMLLLAFGWAGTLTFLEFLGAIILRFHLPWRMPIIFGIMGLAIISVFFLRSQKPSETKAQTSSAIWDYADYILLGLLMILASLTVLGALISPTFDSDAANIDRWVGLSKQIYSIGFLPNDLSTNDKLGPSILPLVPLLFSSRWHDVLAALPWAITYSFFPVAVFSFFRAQSKTRKLSLFFALFVTSIPILNGHTIRPGFSDILSGYLFLLGVMALVLGHWKHLIFISVGLTLTKSEGMVWGLWLLIVQSIVYLQVKFRLQWRNIFFGFLGATLFSFILYFSLADWILDNWDLDYRVRFALERKFNPDVFTAFYTLVFTQGTFHILWWIFLGGSIYYILNPQKNITTQNRVWGISSLILWLFVFYYCCFTGNIPLTLNGTNVGRFHLQLLGLIIPTLMLISDRDTDPREQRDI